MWSSKHSYLLKGGNRMKYDLDLDIDEKNALSLMIQQIEPDSFILEFGPANGRLTRFLKEELNCKVYIVEIDEKAARDAMRYSADAIIGDAEDFEWLSKWEKVKFDYILFADVLEHLRNPQEVLSKTKRLLKDDGKVVMSVPNVSHDSIMINLFNNIFNYTPLGLLDNTHIHLFAYNTLKDFCHYAGYTPVIEDAVYANVGETEIANSYSDIGRDATRALRNKKYGNVYQFVFTLQKTEYIKFNSHEKELRIKSHIPHNDVKIYLNLGNGWNEDNCVMYRIAPQHVIEKKIILANSEDVTAIRIDPLETNGVFRFAKIQLLDENGTDDYSLSDCTCNGAIIGDCLYCEHDDPQIIIEPVSLSGKAELCITFEPVLWDVDADIISYVENNAKAKLEMWEELERKAVEIDKRMELINQLRSEIDAVKNENKLQAEELEHRETELDKRMGVINNLRQENDTIKNENKLQAEELERKNIELERVYEIKNSIEKELHCLRKGGIQTCVNWYLKNRKK